MSDKITKEFLEELYEQNSKAILDDFFKYLSFPSVSAVKEHKHDLLACADWLCDFLNNAGLEAELWETGGHPTVFAQWLGAGEDKPTVLLYGHYDVQPVDPLDLWHSPPFEPQIREGQVYARGALDNKGQGYYTMAALKYILKSEGSLPVNVKVIMEGEEEIGSNGLPKALEQNKEKAKCDSIVIVDLGVKSLEQPSVSLGIRGIVAFTVTFTGSNTDMHSGAFGGIAYNPNRALTEVISSLRDKDNRINIPGFYDGVEDLSEEEKSKINFNFPVDYLKEKMGFAPFGYEKGYSFLETAWTRPTLEVNGISGGYSGEGFKTVIPAKAMAKISCRLVPGQDPDKIAKLVKDCISERTPEGMKVDIEVMHGSGTALRTSPNSKIVQAAQKAYSEVFDKECSFTMEGGSIPVASTMARITGADTALIGLGLPGDQIHAPNERFGLDRLKMGFATIGLILQNMQD